MKDLTRRQHYVWRHYLEAWASTDQINCYSKSRANIFSTSTGNVGNERFFYEVDPITEADLFHLNRVVTGAIRSPELAELARGYVEMFTLADRLERQLAAIAITDEGRKEIAVHLDWARKMLGEKYHGGLENLCVKHLALLRKSDCSFIDNEAEAIEFFHFLANQYFRTPRLRNRIASIPSQIVGHSYERTWPIEAFIYACNIAFGMFARRETSLISFLRNSTSVSLITGDQPVINLLDENDKTIDLYYPLSPVLAMRVSESPEQREYDLTTADVARYNRLMYTTADDQVYADNKAILRALAIA